MSITELQIIQKKLEYKKILKNDVTDIIYCAKLHQVHRD